MMRQEIDDDGGIAMEKKNGIGKGTLLWVAVLYGLSATPFATGVWAYTLCPSTQATLCGSQSRTADCDQDGFSDYDECNGLATTDGASIVFSGYKGPPTPPSADRTQYLDPKTRDLFVIVNKAPVGSLWPSSYIKDLLSTYSTNLMVTIHEIPEPPSPDREIDIIMPVQKAVRLNESLDDSPDFGAGNWGTPNGSGGGNATIWTRMIENYVNNLCATVADASCKSISGVITRTTKANVIADYKKYVLSHEVGHMSKLTGSYNASYGGHHYAKSKTGTLMEQSVYVVTGSSSVTFYIPSGIAAGSRQVPGDLSDSTLNGL